MFLLVYYLWHGGKIPWAVLQVSIYEDFSFTRLFVSVK